MTEYTLILKIPNTGSKSIYYSVNLTGTDINHPEDYFSFRTDRGKNNRLKLLQAIENESLRQVNEEQLNRIINEWNHGIKHGKSNSTTVTISLDTYGSNSNPSPTPSSYPDTASPIHQPRTPIQSPNYEPLTPKKIATPISKSKTPTPPPSEKIIDPPNDKNPPSDSHNSTPIIDTWSTDNKVEF